MFQYESFFTSVSNEAAGEDREMCKSRGGTKEEEVAVVYTKTQMGSGQERKA